jgi:hypothetical protein
LEKIERRGGYVLLFLREDVSSFVSEEWTINALLELHYINPQQL